MLNEQDQKTFYFYGADDILDIVMALQKAYRGRAVVSRTPGGIVAHVSPGVKYVLQQDDSGNEQPSSRQQALSIRVPASGKEEM